jgi:arylsulfatase
MGISRRALLAIAGSSALATTVNGFAQETSKPNIVVWLMDNLGYGELGIYGGGILRGAPTPIIDKLASEGMRLLNFNVEAQCTPSRSALMTGRFPIRSGTYQVPAGGAPGGHIEPKRLSRQRWAVVTAAAGVGENS